MVTNYDMSQVKGDTKTITVNFTDENDAAIDITGSTVYLTVKTDYDVVDGSATFQKTVTSHTAPASGQTTIVVDPADTSAASTGTYKYDIQLTESSGKISTVLSGNYTIYNGVTDA